MNEPSFVVIIRIKDDVSIEAFGAPWTTNTEDEYNVRTKEQTLLHEFERPSKEAIRNYLDYEGRWPNDRWVVYWDEKDSNTVVRPRTLSGVMSPLPILRFQSIRSMLDYIKNIS